MRCLTLADGLRLRGAQVRFCSNAANLISERGYEVFLPSPQGGEGLGVRSDLLIVDHYGLDIAWERTQRPHFKKILVIDDLARAHDCDILLDQNLVANWQTRYTGKVSENCKLLLGPKYALLAPVYAELHDRIPPREGPVKRILVSFGGGEHQDLYEQILQQPGIDYDIATPGKYSSLVPLMAKADLAIGACGISTWERLCLGLPSYVVVLADNQVEISRELIRRELVRQYEGELPSEIEPGWSKRCTEVVDGRGLHRALAVLTADKNMPLQIRHANLKDEVWLLELANDPVTRKNSYSPENITAEEHRAWFYQKLREFDSCCLYILETHDGIPVGQVRFDRMEEQTWEIDYSLASAFRGHLLGDRLLQTALTRFQTQQGSASVVGKVKISNRASQRVFESLGFRAANGSDAISYRKEI